MPFSSLKLTDDVKKDKEKEPEKADKVASSAAPKKKGFEEERKDSDDSSDDELVSPLGLRREGRSFAELGPLPQRRSISYWAVSWFARRTGLRRTRFLVPTEPRDDLGPGVLPDLPRGVAFGAQAIRRKKAVHAFLNSWKETNP